MTHSVGLLRALLHRRTRRRELTLSLVLQPTVFVTTY